MPQSMTDASASRLSLRGLRTASVTLLCCLGVLGSAQAQVVSTVYGNVHDSSFAAIEGATLSFFGMSGIASGLTFNTLSDRLGDYAIQLPYGCSYSVQCTASGYAVNSSFIMADSPGVLLNFQMSTASTPSDHYPVIVVQPKDACVLAGENTLLEVVATGDAPLSVFWRRNGTNLADGGNTSGSSSSILFVQGAGLLDSGQYSVVVTNSLGTVTSRLATLEVALPGIHHFTVDVVSTQNLANYPFAVAVTARDAGNNLVTDYAGTVEITGIFTTNITGRILNGSFDSGSSPSSWTGTGSSTLGYAVGTGLRGGMPTAGTRYLYMFTKDQQAVARGSYYRFTQSVDLTGAKNMTFDAGLFGAVANASEGWTYRAKAEVRIDGLAKWNETFGGLFTDQAIDVSGYSGTHTLEVRCEATRTGTYSSQWVMYDNIRLWGGSTNVPVWPARSGGFVRGVWKGTAR